MSHHQLHLVLVFWLSLACWSNESHARVVQLVAENPSTFVSSDPNDPKFIVSLFEDEVKAASVLPELTSFRTSIMTDSTGQQYNCSIPSSASSWSSSVAPQKDASLPPPVTKTPFELLDSLAGMCFYRQDGLWTYEICHRKHVRQFRQVSFSSSISTTSTSSGTATVISVSGQADLDVIFEAVSNGEDLAKLVGDMLKAEDDGNKNEDFSCGKYSGDDQQVEAVLEDTSSSGHPLRYVSHTYSGGAGCVLTGAPRTAEVRYTCVRDAKENVVLSVREFPTCNYVVVVSTPFLCKHPAFVPPAEDLRLISCIPIGVEQQQQQQQQQPPKGGAAALPDKTAASITTSAAAGNAAKGVKPNAGEQSLDTKMLASSSSSSKMKDAPTGILEGKLLSAESIEDDDDDVPGDGDVYEGDYAGDGAGMILHQQEQRQQNSAVEEHEEL